MATKLSFLFCRYSQISISSSSSSFLSHQRVATSWWRAGRDRQYMSASRSSFGQVYLCQPLCERIINYLAPVKLLISSLSLPLCLWLISHRSHTTTFINAKVISLPARRKPLFGRYRWIPGPLKRLESHRINIFLAFARTGVVADADKNQLTDWIISIISSPWTRLTLITLPFVQLLSAIESLMSFCRI